MACAGGMDIAAKCRRVTSLRMLKVGRGSNATPLPLIIVGGAAVGVEIVIDGDNMLDIVELRCATIESM